MEEENKIIIEEITTDSVIEEDIKQDIDLSDTLVKDEVIVENIQVIQQGSDLNSLEFDTKDGQLEYSEDKATYTGEFTYTTVKDPNIPVKINGKISFNIASGDGIDISADETNSKIKISLENGIITSIETISNEIDNITNDIETLNADVQKLGNEQNQLANDLTNEIANRQSSDNNLQSQINNINENKVDITQLSNYSLKVDSGHTIEFIIDSSTYILTLNLKNIDGTTISTQSVDLPLESMIINGRYNEDTQKIILTLQSGQEISFSVADLISGLVPDTRTINGLSLKHDITLTPADVGALANTTFIPTTLADLSEDENHRVVSDSEKESWNNKVGNQELENYVNKTSTDSENKTIEITNENAQFNINVISSDTAQPSKFTIDTNGLLYRNSENSTSENISSFGSSVSNSSAILQYIKGVPTDLSNNIIGITTDFIGFTDDYTYIIGHSFLENYMLISDNRVNISGNEDVVITAPKITLNDIEDVVSTIKGKAETSDLKTVAFTNDYNDLDNKPVIPEGSKLYETTGQNTDGAMTQKATTDKLELLQSNIPTMLSDLTEDSTHRTVTDSEKNTWNAKSDFGGSYNDLTDKPTIPTINVNGTPQSTINFDSDPQTQINLKSSIKTQTFTSISSVTTFIRTNLSKILNVSVADIDIEDKPVYQLIISNTKITYSQVGTSTWIGVKEFAVEHNTLYNSSEKIELLNKKYKTNAYITNIDNNSILIRPGVEISIPDNIGTWTVTYYE